MGSFKFKQFNVSQDRSAMKVNTDGVLLGAWMDILDSDSKLIDIGTGTGVIALMAAQRATNATILALEIDNLSALEATENFKNSLWSDRLKVLNLSLQSYVKSVSNNEEKVDLIFSNPPFFIDSLKAVGESRNNSRHTDMLTFEEIVDSSKALLKKDGRLAIILPKNEGDIFIAKAESRGLFLKRICYIYSVRKRACKRYLMEFCNGYIPPVEVIREELVIMENSNYTTQYRSLTSEFYLSL